MTHRRGITRAARHVMRASTLAIALAGATHAHARVDLLCTHVTKSTLAQAPLARPVFAPSDTALVSVADDGRVTLRVAGEVVMASLRVCPRGGGGEACGDVRRTQGDVVSVYQDLATVTGPVFAIWGRKGARAQDLIENVIMRCCIAGQAC